MSAVTPDISRPQASWPMYFPYIVPMLISTAATVLVFTNSSVVGWGFVLFLVALQVLEPLLGEEHETYEWKNPQVFDA